MPVRAKVAKAVIPRFINRLLPTDERTRAAIFAALSFFAGTMFSPFCAFTITGTLTSLQERATFPMLAERIELTRRSVGAVPCDDRILAFGVLVSEAMQWNLRITHEKQANRLWYADWLSPDAWNGVELIELPCGEPANL